jgi:phosphohistidine phosphatase
MKSLVIIRHAKSSWADAGMEDFDRPLNERGKKDAPEMAKRLLSKNISIDVLISSTAKRAQQTCRAFAEVYGIERSSIILKPELYLAPAEIFYKVITETNSKYNCIAVFAHNPGITEFANSLTSARIDDMPTCAVYALHISTDNWKDFKVSKKDFWFFDYPKRIE